MTNRQKNDVLYEKALDLYLNDNKPDEALQILFELAKVNYTKAFGEIGVILYREKHDAENAEKWFEKAKNNGALFEEAAYEYGGVMKMCTAEDI